MAALEHAYGRTRNVAVDLPVPAAIAQLLRAHTGIVTLPPPPATPADALTALGVPPHCRETSLTIMRAAAAGEKHACPSCGV